MSNRVEPIRSVKGTRDLLPPDTSLWQRVEAEARRVLAAYHYGEIRTPILEETALFARGVGAETDIVTKEMYTFEDHLMGVFSPADITFLNQGYEDDRAADDRVRSILDDVIRRVQLAYESRDIPQSEENRDAIDRLRKLATKNPAYIAGYMTSVANNERAGKVGFNVHGYSLTLRPEATASVVRAYIEHSLYNQGGIQKLYYIGPMFRRERPQKGRYRQFYQIGAEVLGSQNPLVDVEVIEMLVLFLERVGIREYQLLLNSVGCPQCRAAYLEILRQALQDVKATMCADCQRRADTNPLRVLDCKVEADQPIIEKLPQIIDHLDPECRQHFDRVRSELDDIGIRYQITPRLVRGLDYYTRTTFEITSGALGAQNAVVGGGRYDGLSEMLGGPPTPGIGFSIGEDRLILAVQAALHSAIWRPPWVREEHAYVIWLGENARKAAREVVKALRKNTDVPLMVSVNPEEMALKKALKDANRQNAQFAIIIGENELATGKLIVKDMMSGNQTLVEKDNVLDHIRKAHEAQDPGKPTGKGPAFRFPSSSGRTQADEENQE